MGSVTYLITRFARLQPLKSTTAFTHVTTFSDGTIRRHGEHLSSLSYVWQKEKELVEKKTKRGRGKYPQTYTYLLLDQRLPLQMRTKMTRARDPSVRPWMAHPTRGYITLIRSQMSPLKYSP